MVQETPATPAQRRRDLRASLLLGLACLLVYNANMRLIAAGDTYPARYLPFGILRYGSVLLDPIAGVTAQGRVHPYWIVPVPGGHAVSLYPVVLPVLVAPLYVPAVAYLELSGWTPHRLDRVARIMEKVTASLLAAACTALMYLLLRRRAGPGDGLLLALAFAFGTNTWMIGGQALWQHGLAELLLAGALLLLAGPCTAGRALAAGALLGLLAGNRPPDAVLAAALGLYGLRWAGRRAPLLAAAAAVPAGLVLVYNLAATGRLGGAYWLSGDASFFHHPLLPGIAALLVSPARGLFVFSPFLLLLPFGVGRALRDPGTRGLTLAAGAGVIVQVLLYAKSEWRAGAAWGPRWLTDMLPLLFWMLAPVVVALRGAGRLAFVLATGAAIAIQAIGAFWYTGASDEVIYGGPGGPAGMAAAWNPRNAPFIVELQHPRAPMDLALDVRGNIDRIDAGGREVAAVAPGAPLAVEGWALFGAHPPAEVVVLLDDRPLGRTATFFDRRDVRETLHTSSPAGWRLAFRADGIEPGEHVLEATARVAEGGEYRHLAQRTFRVLAPAPAGQEGSARGAGVAAGPPAPAEPAAAARRAVALLAANQQAAGYWLTVYTGAPRFEAPRPELNTFLVSMLVDLLEPVAAAAGLDESLQRARRYLAGQVEASGLVRYHGRPDAPTIPSLGCAITPDADDTALVWRIAGGERALRSRALAALGRYRTGDGLYRTWLAPPERYQCVDPGKDPNPADAGIQMHVYLLLATAEPPAARALCRSLARTIAEDRVWVYYQAAPLVPLLRAGDLRRAGCPLRLPEPRQRTGVPGQEIWLAAGRLLERYLGAGGPAPSPAETSALLAALSRDDFAAIRRSPPLLYHNDLTASTPRYYWSADFGYALWIRLYLRSGASAASARGSGAKAAS